MSRLEVFLTTSIIATTAALGIALTAQGQTPATCPSPQPCKILTLSQEEEQALVASITIADNPNRQVPGIFATAEQARPLDLGGAVRYFRDKIANAPRGIPQPPPAPEGEKK